MYSSYCSRRNSRETTREDYFLFLCGESNTGADQRKDHRWRDDFLMLDVIEAEELLLILIREKEVIVPES